MTGARLRAAAFGTAALVFVTGAVFPLAAAHRVGIDPSWRAVVDGALPALAPALAIIVLTRYARGHTLASWAALVGGLLTWALGIALYAAALRPESRPGAAVLAVTFVPLRQLVAVAFAAWAASLVKRTREGG